MGSVFTDTIIAPTRGRMMGITNAILVLAFSILSKSMPPSEAVPVDLVGFSVCLCRDNLGGLVQSLNEGLSLLPVVCLCLMSMV